MRHPKEKYLPNFRFWQAMIFAAVLGAYADEKTKNPVAPDGADPWVTYREGYYYYCYSGNDKIWINKKERLVDAVQQQGKAVWEPPAGTAYSRELWAPELHFLNGKWYIYFAADDGRNENHRMYVLESRSDNVLGDYAFRGKISDPSDCWAIDGTVMQYNDKLYFLWSGWEGKENIRQHLYIAPMSDPVTISGERVLISAPTYAWETAGTPHVNEGPEVLRNGHRLFIIYSASGSWTDSYCLGQLTLIGSDPLNARSWRKKSTPVFAGSAHVVSPGHASFTTSPDGKEHWIVYHAAKRRGAGWNRNIRAQRFGWNKNGEPVFGTPQMSAE